MTAARACRCGHSEAAHRHHRRHAAYCGHEGCICNRYDERNPMTSPPDPTYDAAFREGAAAERDRIRQLAVAHNAWCIPPYGCTDLKCQNCSARPLTGPFAELLDGAP